MLLLLFCVNLCPLEKCSFDAKVSRYAHCLTFTTSDFVTRIIANIVECHYSQKEKAHNKIWSLRVRSKIGVCCKSCKDDDRSLTLVKIWLKRKITTKNYKQRLFIQLGLILVEIVQCAQSNAVTGLEALRNSQSLWSFSSKKFDINLYTFDIFCLRLARKCIDASNP